MSVKIFLSTVSDEFRRYRDLLRSDLTRHNVEVKVQEDFKDLGGETLDKLDAYIAHCDAVVHLVGDMTGAYPGERGLSAWLAKYPDLPAKLPPLSAALSDGVGVSYTQWEAWLALYHGKLLLIARAAETAERDSKYRPTHDSRTAQDAHLARLRAVERYPGTTFTSADSLAKYVLGGALLDLLVQAYAEEVAAGRDVNFGLSPEQVKELTEAAARGATGPLTSAIVDLSKRLGVTEDATKTLLRIVGEQDVPLERLSETLNRVANDYKRLQAQAAALNPDNPTARDLVTQARAAINAGQFERAHQLLHEATQAQLAAAQAARKLREQAQAAEDAQMLGAASVAAVNAGVALTEGKYQQAAELFGQAAEYVPPGHPDERGGYLSGQADALYRQGDELGDSVALSKSIGISKQLSSQEYARDRVPLDWARTQNYLGNALCRLGEREGGTVRLEEAVAAYRAALDERRRDRVPLDWAATQTNLGTALFRLGERESETAWLEEAVAAYRAALEERTRDRVPLDWAMTQNNLGGALFRLGERESGTARLEEAVAAYRAALKEYTRDRVPLDWARTQHYLGTALCRLGEREGGTARLEEAVAAFAACLTVPVTAWPAEWVQQVRSHRVISAMPRLFCVIAQSSGTRSRVHSSSAAR